MRFIQSISLKKLRLESTLILFVVNISHVHYSDLHNFRNFSLIVSNVWNDTKLLIINVTIDGIKKFKNRCCNLINLFYLDDISNLD